MRLASTVAMGSVLSAAGCWGEVVDVYPDASADASGTDTGTGGNPAEPEKVPGGGASGGAIAGRLNVFVVDAFTDSAVAQARVMVGDDPDTALLGVTDSDGLAIFEASGLEGPVDVHALASGHALASVLSLDAANLTLPIEPLQGQEPDAGTATVQGTIEGLDESVPELGDPDILRFASVRYGLGMRDLFGREPAGIEPAGGLILPDADGPSFSVEIPARPGALYALAGLLDTQGTLVTSDDEFTPLAIGIVPGFEPEADDTVTDVTVDVSTGLAVTVNAYFSNLPAAYGEWEMALGLDMGERGTAWMPGSRSGNTCSFKALDDADVPEGVPLLVVSAGRAGSSGEVDFEDFPLGSRLVRDIGSFEGWTDGPYAVTSLLPPPMIGAFDGETLVALTSGAVAMSGAEFRGAAAGEPLWTVIVIGPMPGALELPRLPDEWAWDGLPVSGLNVRVWALDLDADPNDLAFRAIPDVARGRSEDMAEF